MRHAVLIMSLVIVLGLGILALPACTNSTPPLTSSATSAASTTPSPQALSGDSIEAVYSTVASIIGGSPLSPLFGDWPEDRAAIDRLALALDTAVPITPTEYLEANDRGRYLRIRYRDGTQLMVRQVTRCEPRSDAKDSVGASCRGRWVHLSDTWWVEGTGMVKSAELGLWWEDMTTFMVRIGETIEVGGSFLISGWSWHRVVEAPAMKLSLISADGLETKLAEIPVSPTYFEDEVMLPGQTPRGRYWLRVTSGDFSELVDVIQVG